MLINESVTIPPDKAVTSRLERKVNSLLKLSERETDELRSNIMKIQAAVIKKYAEKAQTDSFDLGQYYDDIVSATLEVIGDNETIKKHYLNNFDKNYKIVSSKL